MKTEKWTSPGVGIRDGNDDLVFVPAFDCSPVLSLLCNSMQGVPCDECPSSLGWEEKRMVVVSREVMNEIGCGAPLSSTPTRLNDCARIGLAPRCEHTTLDTYVLPVVLFPRDRLSDRNCGRDGA